MEPMYYIGLDVHKQKISYCVKDASGKLHAEGWISGRVRIIDTESASQTGEVLLARINSHTA